MYENIKPLYKELHAYVRYNLVKKYPNRFRLDGPIPAHLFGNLWAQDWSNLLALVTPYPDAKQTNIDKAMLDNKWTVKKMVLKTEEFYTSMGLEKMTDIFWKKSYFERPTNRSFDCHASAYTLESPGDFR